MICWQAKGCLEQNSLLKKKNNIYIEWYACKPWASLGVILAEVKEPSGTHHSVSRSKACVRLSRRVSSHCSCVAGVNLLLVSYTCSSAKGNWNLVEFEGRGLSIHWGVGCPVSLTDGCLSLTFPTSSLKDRHSHQYVFNPVLSEAGPLEKGVKARLWHGLPSF